MQIIQHIILSIIGMLGVVCGLGVEYVLMYKLKNVRAAIVAAFIITAIASVVISHQILTIV